MPLLSILLGAILAIASPSAEPPLPAPQPSGEVIRVISNSHSIEFPNEVVLNLEAEADSQIMEVTLFYQLGRQTTRIYGYPSFARSNRVNADFRIETSGSNYIPSGVDIEYYYFIRDAEGNELETERFSLEYKDPGYEWQSFRQGGLIVLWHDRPFRAVQTAAHHVNDRLREVRELLALQETPPMKAVILNSSREAGRSFPVVSATATRGHLYGGFAFGELDVFVLAGLDRDSMIHEMTHLLMDEALDSPLAKVPAWLNEGLAMYFETHSGGREATVSRAAGRGELLPLRSMGAVPGIPSDVRLFYAQSWSLVDYMMNTYGDQSMSALLGALNEGRSIDEAVRIAYGMDINELENRWKTSLSGRPSKDAQINPGLIGTSFLVAGSVVVTSVALLIRWLRQGPTEADTP